MRCARFEIEGQPMIGTIEGNAIHPQLDSNAKPFSCMRKFIEAWTAGTRPKSGRPIPASNVRFLHPVRRPEKIFCIGLNYSDHAAETGATVGNIPVVFSKFSSALLPPGDPIRLPSISDKVDFEAELVVVIGKGGRNIPRDVATEHVFGYCCGNDVSARDWQKGKPGGQWLLGKTPDTFAPTGPYLVTADEVDPSNLKIGLKLNGEVMQASSTRELIFSVEELIAHVSLLLTLQPGDLIYTGTPAGVGAVVKGDVMVGTIAGLGELRVRMI